MTYQEKKENARQKAIDLQEQMSQISLSYKDLIYFQTDIEKLGKRYGLLNEFRENGLI